MHLKKILLDEKNIKLSWLDKVIISKSHDAITPKFLKLPQVWLNPFETIFKIIKKNILNYKQV